MKKEIPAGYCQCGCGGKTKLITKHDKRKGWIKGEYFRFIQGHWSRVKKPFNTKKFWSRVCKTDTCWEWTGSKNPAGYGMLMVDRKTQGAHRISWILANGPIPQREGKDQLFVLHKCDNPPCVNPNHLFLGTAKDNTHDCISKGRAKFWGGETRYAFGHTWSIGQRNSQAKLTDAQVKEILAMRGTHSQVEIAATYGVSHTTIYRIFYGLKWRHLVYDALPQGTGKRFRANKT